ncbi:MAG: NADH-quinone oxidoreductase subunit M [Acidobacteriota bacterium]|nr:NADH-quinone oxidoreductase subunit M [Acidobacteriota bacterium]
MPNLSIVIWLPALSGLLASLIPARRRMASGAVALAGAMATFALAVWLVAGYSPGAGLSDVTDVTWIGALGIHYKLGVDGLNVALVGLTALLYAVAVLAGVLRLRGSAGTGDGGGEEVAPGRGERVRLYHFLFMLSESAVLGAFLAQDLALFVAFFDLMLIPFYLLIGTFGRGERVRATLKLVIYTFVGSLLMLAAAIATGVLASRQHGTPIDFSLSALAHLPLSRGSQEWIFLFFAAAFLVKMPAFPLQGWMPDGYRAMPTEVVMVFSGVLSKVGAYGFLRIVLPLFPAASVHFQLLMLLIALISILYGSVQAFSQDDARLIAGYSSVAQLGFITLGIFSLTPQGAQGALLGMVNHGLVVAPIFFIIALLAQRASGSEDIRRMGGVAFRAPVLATLFLIVALATLAMPGSANFVGEFLILLGVFKAKLAIAIVATAGVVMASVYALRLFIRSMHDRVGAGVKTREITLGDGLVLAPLVGAILFLALYPQVALRRSEGSVKESLSSARAALRAPAQAAQAPGGAASPAAQAPAESAAEGGGR